MPASLRDQSAILVIEDDPGIRSLLVTVLRRAGFEVESAGDGREALELLRTRRFKMALLDLVLPEVDGFAVLEHVAEFAPKFLSCIVVVSAVSPAIIERHGVPEKVFKVLQKPFDLDELVATVSRCMDAIPVPAREEDHFLGIRAASEEANARAGLVGVVGTDPVELKLLWSYGYTDEMLASYPVIPIDRTTPMGMSVVEKRPVWVASQDEVARSYPSLLATMKRNSTHALAAAPIIADGRVAGTVGWSFATPQAFDEPQKNLLLSIVEDYGKALATEL